MKPEFIITRTDTKTGKEKVSVSLPGLLDEAHAQGLKAVLTKRIQAPTDANGFTAVYRALVRTGKGTFTGHGDANPKNVESFLIPAIERMAETRAVARALRWATNSAASALEELRDIADCLDNKPAGNATTHQSQDPAGNPTTTDNTRRATNAIPAPANIGEILRATERLGYTKKQLKTLCDGRLLKDVPASELAEMVPALIENAFDWQRIADAGGSFERAQELLRAKGLVNLSEVAECMETGELHDDLPF